MLVLGSLCLGICMQIKPSGPRSKCADMLLLGYWSGNGSIESEMRWRLFDEQCSLRDGLACASQRNLSVLNFGDSVDREMVRDICRVGPQAEYKQRFSRMISISMKPFDVTQETDSIISTYVT